VPLRLHLNENSGCSPAVIAALRALSPSDIASYPDYAGITARVAGWLGVTSDAVLLTNGLDEGLYGVAQYAARQSQAGARDSSGRCELLQVEPTFEMFEEFARIVGGVVVRVAPEADFAFPLQRTLASIGPATGAIYLVDPNNPTGLPLPSGAAEQIAAAAPHALVLVDEAYADFCGRTLIGPALERHENLVVGRTFAKAHGLAGLRVGALVAHPATLARLRSVMPPFNVNVAAVTALHAALDDDGYLKRSVSEAAEARRLMADFCDRRGLATWPSAGNFMLLRVGDQATAVAAQLAARGILVRDKSGAAGCHGCLRITTGSIEHTRATLSALEDILASRTN
jgi:histidinol-phosphate aminotransferase